MHSNYDKYPFIPVTQRAEDCAIGWPEVMRRIAAATPTTEKPVVCVECYPGVFLDDVVHAIREAFPAASIIRSEEYFKSPAEIESLVARELTDDPVFGFLSHLELSDFIDLQKLKVTTDRLAAVDRGVFFVVGTGAALSILQPDLLVYADLARWEIQQRQRRGEVTNLGANNASDRAALQYKRGFFLDWRVADRLKKKLLPRLDLLLDTNDRSNPKLISGQLFREGLRIASQRPFRVVPFFDPGPWGGQWMREVCGLEGDAPNYAWCFDCVPEENSLLLGFGDCRIEVPAIDLVFSHPRELLGDAVHGRFGTEFPIRFDFLDTMGGGNLSLQVHPLTEYIQEHFGMQYTQDESYYLLDAGKNACVYLGLKNDVDPLSMEQELRAAQAGGAAFAAEKHTNRWPAQKHDHFLIPAGTIHCSGSESMVLEISATPYIFTFKLWDWGRLGLDGRPRPIHLEHGLRNIQWDRTTEWVKDELINRFEPLGGGIGWREERTGLHCREFIETRRHWFTEAVRHNTNGGVNVLNLVEGEAAVVESPHGAFEPFTVHYAETFIVPAAVGEYVVRPIGPAKKALGTLKAFVRTNA
jgi:mannose-6-phosphate isomerase class I